MNRPRVVIVLVVLLVVSVGINLFFAGMTGGKLFRSPPDPPPGQLPNPGQINDILPDNDRAAFRAMRHARGPALRANGLAQREAGLEVIIAARAEPFDGDQLRKALTALRTAQSTGRELRDDAFVDLMQHLSADGRHRLVDALPGLREQPPPN